MKFIIFLIAVVHLEKALGECEPVQCTRQHEYYTTCGHACSLTCDNYKDPPMCIAMCQEELAGCYCEDPYVRNKDGDCVLAEECEDTTQICTHAHESYRSCSNGCETTCDNYENPPMCIQACLPDAAGCYCDYPYVRNENGDCVLEEECKDTAEICTHAHETYHGCSNGCETTCDNYKDPPMCIQACLPEAAGCYCDYPYVRNKDGDCVLEEECEIQTSTCTRPHEYYTTCGHACALTCDNYKDPPMCIAMCQEELAGCYCEDPYVRNKVGDCVLEQECEDTTQICTHAHESYRSCSNGCEISCDNFKNPPMCIQACLAERAGCYCDYPYVRSKTGDCVKKDRCIQQALTTCTRPHEKYQGCSNGCETTCDNYNNPPICAMNCSTKYAGCYCEYPYLRNDKGDCVLKNQCQRKTSSLFTSILDLVKEMLKLRRRSEHSVASHQKFTKVFTFSNNNCNSLKQKL